MFSDAVSRGSSGSSVPDITEHTREFIILMNQNFELVHVNRDGGLPTPYLGRTVFAYMDPAYHAELRLAVERMLETSLPQHLETEGLAQHGGIARYSNWVFELSSPDASQRLIAFIATDVTYEDDVQYALARSQHTLQALIEYAPDYIAIVDRDGRIEFENRRFAATLADSAGSGEDDSSAEAGRHSLADLIPADQLESARTHFASAFESGSTVTFEFHSRAEGPRRDYLARLSPVADHAEPTRLVLIATDVTAQKEAQRQREALAEQLHHTEKHRAIGQLTGGVAHDFNNLLLVISGNIEAALAASSTQDADADLERALESVDRAAGLTQHLLSISRRQLLNSRRTDVVALVSEMRHLLGRTLGDSIEVEAIDESTHGICDIDPVRLESALLNLGVNARDAMPGGGRLLLHTSNLAAVPGGAESPSAADSTGSWLRIAVTDTGSGMSPEVLAQACDPFFTTKSAGSGSGLGLSVAYGFVHQSGGRMQLSSEPGRGTTVEILFPCAQDHTAEGPQHARLGVERRGDGEHILVIEDEPEVRTVIARMLRELGYRVSVAANGIEAMLRLQAAGEVHGLISDVVLPGGLNGAELTEKVRELHPELPVLLVSGYSEHILAQHGPLPTDVGMLRKPFDRAQLARAISNMLAAPPRTREPGRCRA